MIGVNKPYEMTRGASATGADDKTIWDTTYVSTVPQGSHPWNYQTEARPNHYLEVYIPEQAPSGEVGDTASDSVATIAAKRLASLRSANSARYQLIRGAFNINSTSSAAWSSVLGASLRGWDTQDNGPTDVSGAFFRVPHGAQEKGLANLVPSASLTDATALTAVGRRLTATEIDNLAGAIVTQIKARNKPFISLGEFAGSTVLSTAIANAGPGLNSSISTAAYQHAAGAVTPGDILAAIAPFMAARSDTFKIRVYGDAVNPMTNEVTGRVWCEAMVQRVPDLCPSPGDANAASKAVGTVVTADPSVYTFGRKFQVTSFRWLNPDEL